MEQWWIVCVRLRVCVCVRVFKEERRQKINRCSMCCLSIGYLKEEEEVREDAFVSLGCWCLRQVFKSMGNYPETSEVGLWWSMIDGLRIAVPSCLRLENERQRMTVSDKFDDDVISHFDRTYTEDNERDSSQSSMMIVNCSLIGSATTSIPPRQTCPHLSRVVCTRVYRKRCAEQ